jgi:quinohemoprotein amine dehydrogenase beta subunit
MNKIFNTVAAVSLGVALLASPQSDVLAKDYILAVSKPNNLHLVDPESATVINTCALVGRGSAIAISPSPADTSIAYVLTNGWGEIVGVNIDTCETVFHAVLSQGNTRARSIAGMTVSNDGKEIYAQMSEVDLLSDRYKIRDMHRVAVFKADAGLDAQPYRSFDIPRGHTILVPSEDNETLWSFGSEIRQFDMKSGAILQEVLLNSWEDARPTYGDPDGLSFWPLWDNVGMMIAPYFAPVFANREARDAGDWDQLADFVVGTTTVDLSTNTWTQKDITSADVLIFSMSRDPRDNNIVYGVYTQLSKYDEEKGELVARVDLDHTYYSVAMSESGEKLYIGSTFNDIAIHSSDTLEQIAKIELPGGDQGACGIRVIHR